MIASVMEDFIQTALNLPGTRVVEVSRIERGHWLIRVESTLKGTACKRCGRQITDFHGLDSAIRLRHLPIFDVPVFLELRPKRYRCRFCDGAPTTTQRLDWYEPRSSNTRAYEQWLLRMLINTTVADVARKFDLTEELVEGVLDRWIATEVSWDEYAFIGTLGLDEVALKKGHRSYVTIVSMPLVEGGMAILAVLPDRKKQTVTAFLASIPERLKPTIERVCVDMYEGYTRAVEEQLPEAHIVVDRFHVARLYRGCADAVRKAEMKRLKRELSQASYAEVKGSMWALRKAPVDRTPDEQQLVERVYARSPAIKTAQELREQLTAIFDRPLTKRGAKRALRAWSKRVRSSGLTAFDRFLGTLDAWLDPITNYFENRDRHGFVEGFNTRVKVLKRRCYGIFNVERIFQRLYLDLDGYRLFAIT